MTRVLFVCIGNSCRSPMAEAFANHLGAGVVEASSAGVYAAPIIQPETIQVMAERGIRLEPREPRNLLFEDPSKIDLVVNMSGVPLAPLRQGLADREIVWHVRDPIGQTPEIYRQVRDEIERKVVELLKELR
ncbi:MAG: low molecular weight phosphatase family protein [Acidobacteria bacterium]|nr:low molecular weight phosphatase family protein [Acidobacteriota bacterium]